MPKDPRDEIREQVLETLDEHLSANFELDQVERTEDYIEYDRDGITYRVFVAVQAL